MATFDVVVAGGGPAGARAACQLAAGGATVALVDGSHPREKPCGGGVTGRALSLLGFPVQRVEQGMPIASASFTYRDKTVAMPLADQSGGLRLAVVPRRTFDARLVECAEQAGVTLLRARVTGVTRSARRWRVMTRDGELEGAWLIGADGPGSLVRRRVAAPFARADLSIAAGYYVHGATSQQIDIAFEEDPPGYLWSFPRPDHLAVGACAQADESTTTDLLLVAQQWIDRHVTGGTRERYSWPIPSLRAETLQRERPSGDGWMLAGDAAGLVDPITREGIFFALLSAEHAAASILEGADPAGSYAERLRDTIYSELILAARLKARFFQPRFMGLLISALQRSSRIRAIMSDLVAGEQPYASLRRRLVRTVELRLMLELFGIASAS
ncbi:MAG TPA: NAD(P)/FAD-dependent oxidoreductase [Vicinamibacterales bacterium]|nr:NAD(P)/FAD-dependent oxidoreductase [Vicinamibacterales bacterium]